MCDAPPPGHFDRTEHHSVRTCAAHRRPTIIRENKSTMKQTYATPAHVGTNVRSVDPQAVAVAVDSRLTRSGCLAAAARETAKRVTLDA